MFTLLVVGFHVGRSFLFPCLFTFGSSPSDVLVLWHIPAPPCRAPGRAAGAGWGNEEAQCYTSNSRNLRVERVLAGARGVLAIEAAFHEKGISCSNPGAPDSTRFWSSARIATRGKAAFGFDSTAVKFQARVKLPAGQCSLQKQTRFGTRRSIWLAGYLPGKRSAGGW
jgi:hypothetical protein